MNFLFILFLTLQACCHFASISAEEISAINSILHNEHSVNSRALQDGFQGVWPPDDGHPCNENCTHTSGCNPGRLCPNEESLCYFQNWVSILSHSISYLLSSHQYSSLLCILIPKILIIMAGIFRTMIFKVHVIRLRLTTLFFSSRSVPDHVKVIPQLQKLVSFSKALVKHLTSWTMATELLLPITN